MARHCSMMSEVLAGKLKTWELQDPPLRWPSHMAGKVGQPWMVRFLIDLVLGILKG